MRVYLAFHQRLSGMFKNIFSSFYLLPILVCIYPVSFLYSQNTNMVSISVFGVNLLFMMVPALVIAFLIFCGAQLASIVFRDRDVIKNIFNTFVVFLLFLLFFAYCYVPIRPYFLNAYWFACFASVISLCVAVFAYRFGVLRINFFLGLMCVFAFMNIGFSLYQRDRSELESKQLQSILFKSHPDIFIVLAESYNSFDEQEKSYDLKDTRLNKYLKENDFKTEAIYSNYDHTYASILAIFLMEHHYNNKLVGNKDLTYGVRGLVNGGRSNPALSILKENGYFIALMDNGIFTNKGELVDYMPENSGELPILVAEVTTILKSFRYTSLFFDKIFSVFLTGAKALPTDKYLEVAFNSNVEHKPGFYFTRDGAEHAKEAFHIAEKDWIADYRRYIKRGDASIIRYLELIKKNSPDSIVIVIGDHGAYRTAAYDRREVASAQERVDDIYRVLFALKLPKGMSLTSGWSATAESHVNILPKVFSLLSGNNELLRNAESESHSIGLGGNVLAVEGKALN